MAWTLRFATATSHELKRMDPADARLIVESLERMAADYSAAYEAELLGSGRLKRLKGEWAGFMRLRLRTFRVIYKKYNETLLIFVVRIAHRRESYR